MIWNSFVKRFAITSRRKGLATAVVYGLSLAVRFTSATGEEVEIPPQSAQRVHPIISIMTGNGAHLPYQLSFVTAGRRVRQRPAAPLLKS